jgi:hypothetical protein
MNFIAHFRNWVSHAECDTRLKSHHVSLYIALFRYWNQNRFSNPFTIYRHEIMALSKIGSINTYTKSLRELTEWNYIRYEPSFDPQVGSKVHLYRFDKGGDQGSGKSGDEATGKGSGKAPATYSINIPNSTNIKNNVNAYDTSHEDSDFVNDNANDASSQDDNATGEEQKKSTEGGRAGGDVAREAIPKNLEAAQAYFVEIKSTGAEAEKFFNHFQSNGWKVGGRSAMKDWRAAARNWVINAQKFNHGNTSQPKPGKLNTGPKNYAEPL